MEEYGKPNEKEAEVATVLNNLLAERTTSKDSLVRLASTEWVIRETKHVYVSTLFLAAAGKHLVQDAKTWIGHAGVTYDTVVTNVAEVSNGCSTNGTARIDNVDRCRDIPVTAGNRRCGSRCHSVGDLVSVSLFSKQRDEKRTTAFGGLTWTQLHCLSFSYSFPLLILSIHIVLHIPGNETMELDMWYRSIEYTHQVGHLTDRSSGGAPIGPDQNTGGGSCRVFAVRYFGWTVPVCPSCCGRRMASS